LSRPADNNTDSGPHRRRWRWAGRVIRIAKRMSGAVAVGLWTRAPRQRVALQFWHLGAAKKKADREA